MRISDPTKEKLSFIAHHLLYASVFYYLLLLVLDIALKGLVSFFFKISSLMGIILAGAIILAYLNTGKLNAEQKRLSPALIYVLSAIAAIIIFFALLPHDALTASLLAILTPALVLINRRYLCLG